MKKKAAKKVVKGFVKHISRHDVEEKLSELLQTAMSSHVVDDWNGEQRVDAIFYTTNITKLIKAIFKIYADDNRNNSIREKA
ncbi:hypothetical protein [Chitinophaga alhagiae]|uniref:hypothetical protein n=1 Tax=Chitinophaga alhagiae TaxID=2203219 RepID=UPI000E5B9A3C|nr:hypothetical protein [Chitinophaga alhagiae]